MSTTKSKIGNKTYLQLISTDSKKAQAEELEFAAQEAEHTVNVAVLETKKSIFNAKKRLKEAQKAQPYVLANEIELINKIEGLEAGLVIAEQIQSTRFNG